MSAILLEKSILMDVANQDEKEVHDQSYLESHPSIVYLIAKTISASFIYKEDYKIWKSFNCDKRFNLGRIDIRSK